MWHALLVDMILWFEISVRFHLCLVLIKRCQRSAWIITSFNSHRTQYHQIYNYMYWTLIKNVIQVIFSSFLANLSIEIYKGFLNNFNKLNPPFLDNPVSIVLWSIDNIIHFYRYCRFTSLHPATFVPYHCFHVILQYINPWFDSWWGWFLGRESFNISFLWFCYYYYLGGMFG